MSFAQQAGKPNILLILADDLGYHDVGFQGCTDIPTPNLDSLAKRSIRCTNGYVTHPFCSPTRAGLLTGRYQQRFGHEHNPVWNPDDAISGLPVSETTLPQVLAGAGYATGAIGKWHLGAHPQFHPNKRGFQEYVGFLGGGHIYLPGAKGGAEYNLPINRNGVDEPQTGYMTDFLGREASDFVSRHRSEPWFLYLAFNAPHTPLQAMEKHLERVSQIKDDVRRNYAGLVVGLDDAVGEVLKKLKETEQEEKTLVFFMSDNGGPTLVTHSDNAPLRGSKGSVYEGGMRVPFLVSWPSQLSKGKDYSLPVSSLDVFATAVELAQAKVPDTHHPEGVNLIPYLKGDKKESPHQQLFWRSSENWAVRSGDMKLLGTAKTGEEMFNLSSDIGEEHDLSKQDSNSKTGLRAAYDTWNSKNIPPIFSGPKDDKRQKKTGGK